MTETKERWAVYRFINNIGLNGKEYILEDDGFFVKLFDSKEEIFELLGVKDEDELEEQGVFIESESELD